MPAPEQPKAFLSHASEDKERFVLPFAGRLRARGIDVWVDRWEMLPGDSLVGKIFREGLEQAAAVIVVVSRVSVTKRWVTEELDAAVVKRIQEGSRLIPVVLDGLRPADVPAPIRHLLFEPVPDLAAIDDVVDRVVRAIHGQPDKPVLGPSPAYTRSAVTSISGLDRIDSLVLKAAGEEAVRDFGTRFDTTEFVASLREAHSVSETETVESLEVLDNVGYVRLSRTMGSGIQSMSSFSITTTGLEKYLRAYEATYPQIEELTLAQLASWPEAQGTERELSELVGAPRLVVTHIIERCEAAGLLRIGRTLGGPSGVDFFSISPRIRRLAHS